MTTDAQTLIAIDDIVANADQPRQTFVDDSLNELAASIKEHGIIQPLIVVENDDPDTAHYPYRLIAGERRLRAAKIAGLTEVPCIVRNTVPDAQTEFEMALIENIQREDLSPADEARAYQRLHTEFKLTDEQIAQRVGKARSTVANTRRLAQLPEAVLSIVGEGAGQLHVRDARRLIPISRLIQPAELIKAATTIAGLDPDERTTIDRQICQLVETSAEVVAMPTDRSKSWALAWPKAPIEVKDTGGARTIPACVGCESYLALRGVYGGTLNYCLNRDCHAAKAKLFAAHELERVSKEMGIPAVVDGEKAGVLTIDRFTMDKVRKWAANPPKHLRLTINANAKRADAYYHIDLTKSPVVFLASTDPDALQDKPADKAGSGKVVTGGVSPSISVGALSKAAITKETPEEKTARLKREAEERQEREAAERKELLAHWKMCGLRRKARADGNWLVVHTAKTLAAKVPLTGLWLEIFANKVEDDYVEFDAVAVRADEIEQALHKATKAAEREALLREKVLLFLICDGSPDEQDWPGVKKHVTEFITGAPGKNGAGGLGLKYTLPEPPIHHTESNCWTCGTFAPYDEIAKEQIEEGWIVVQGGKGSDPTNVTCPACAQKSATRPAPKPSAKKASAKK